MQCLTHWKKEVLQMQNVFLAKNFDSKTFVTF